ncbi:MAG: chemotaxis protein CheA [Pseudomonadota bacterium]
MKKYRLDNLLRPLVAVSPPRWDDAATALDAAGCPEPLRRRLAECIQRQAPLDEIWPALDELAGWAAAVDAVGGVSAPNAVGPEGPPTGGVGPEGPPTGGVGPEGPPTGGTGTPIDWSPPPIGDDMIREFFSEVDGFLADLGPLLVDASPETPEILDEIHRRLHTIKGNSGMVGLTPLMWVVHAMEDLVKKVQAGASPLDDPTRSILLEGLGVATEVTRVAREGSRDPVAWEAYRQKLVTRMDGGRAPTLPAAAMPAAPVRRKEPPPIERVERRPATPSKALTGDATRTLRVDFARLDSLVNLVGEQVTTENRLARVVQQFRARLDELRPKVEGDVPAAGVLPTLTLEDGTTWSIEDFYEALEHTAAELDITSGKLQASVLGMRMVPVDRLFNRHKATVFQISNVLEKKARVVVEGGAAELDKRLVEQLEDPLLHLVRNAVSHGVDAPEARRQQGKPEEGIVTLRAYPEGNLMVIEVADDGVGIDHEILRRKAVEKGFLRKEEAAALDNREAMELIFAPGFSTTSQVDDISGRGVGLDVVQERVARLGGAVTVESTKGVGTTFRLTVPLTLALTRVLLVEAGGDTIAIPVATVRQVHQLEEVKVVEVSGRTMASVGKDTLPYVDLGFFLGLAQGQASSEGTVVLVRVVHGERLALFRVDRVLTQQQVVVKDMGALLSHVPHCMGATINDDRCVLILDSASVIREWGRRSSWLLPPDVSGAPSTDGAGGDGAPRASVAAPVVVIGDPGRSTGLEGTPLFRLLRIPADAVIPDAAAAILVVHDDNEGLGDAIRSLRTAVGHGIPIVGLVTSGDAPAAHEIFKAGADDAWGEGHPAAERVERLERILTLYRHVVGTPGSEEETP